MPYTESGIGFQKTDTSRQSAERKPAQKVSIREQVLDVLRSATLPISTEEIADMIGRPYVSVQPRLSELQDMDLVRDSGRRGETKWGRACILWESVPSS